jgi:hypothetical protein
MNHSLFTSKKIDELNWDFSILRTALTQMPISSFGSVNLPPTVATQFTSAGKDAYIPLPYYSLILA